MKTVIGVIYGLVLTVLGFLAAAGGHGTYVLIGVASAPLSLLGVTAAFIAPPFIWATLFATSGRVSVPRVVPIGVLTVHYSCGLLLLVWPSSAFGDWTYVSRLNSFNRGFLVLGFVWYAMGQVLVWRAILKQKRIRPPVAQ